jgi:agmatinase
VDRAVGLDVHFDAHIDTWNPNRYAGSVSEQAKINHGTFFWSAYEQGFIKPNSSIHAGIRTRFEGPQDLDDDNSTPWSSMSMVWIKSKPA